MTSNSSPADRIRPLRVGILFALLAVGFGFGLGGAFGAIEDQIKGHLDSEGRAVLDSVYAGDEAAMKKVTAKSWVYMKRAHLHGGAIGSAALVLILLLSTFERSSDALRGGVATALGVGALGYSTFWMLAALRAPGVGDTGAAKESLAWFAIPSSGLVLGGLLAVIVLFVMETFAARSDS
jgi:hypothetical protein